MELADTNTIEEIVGVERHRWEHYGRLVDGTFYILHSRLCKETERDLRKCVFSLAYDQNSLKHEAWEGIGDRPVRLAIRHSPWLVPLTEGANDGEKTS